MLSNVSLLRWMTAVFVQRKGSEENLLEWAAGIVHRACTGNAERQLPVANCQLPVLAVGLGF